MKAFRISWLSFLEDDTALDGRSLVYAKSEQEALQKFLSQKSVEYNIHQNNIQIVSIIELPQLSVSEKSDS